jgi:hypothetical protein
VTRHLAYTKDMTNLNKPKRHLTLKTETIRTLNDKELAQAAGGTWSITVPIAFVAYMGAVYYVTGGTHD